MRKPVLLVLGALGVAIVVVAAKTATFWTEQRCLAAGGSLDDSGRFCLAPAGVFRMRAAVLTDIAWLALAGVLAAAVLFAVWTGVRAIRRGSRDA